MKTTTLYLLLIFTFIFVSNTFSQVYRKIRPLQSNCEEIKEILNIGNCEYPQTRYENEKYVVKINFLTEQPKKFDEICWNIKERKVESVEVVFKKGVPISLFDSSLTFVKNTNNDIGTRIYENKEKGILAYVQQDIIDAVIFKPSPSDYKMYSYPCKSKDRGDGIDFSGLLLLDRFWSLSPREEVSKFNNISNEVLTYLKNRPETYVYIVFYYNRKKDIILGEKKASKIKRHLEKSGVKINKLNIHNGGREKRSEVAIYLSETTIT